MNKCKILIIFTILILSFVVKSQTPSEDPNHYILDTEDNFNSFNSSLWNSVPNNTWGLETYNSNNVTAYGGAPNSSTTFPLYWQFKHFRYYRLKTDCTNGITQSNFNFSGHDYKVQKFYSLINSTVPNNSNIVLRTTDYIELKGEFTVPLGSTFTATTHCYTCPD